MKRIFAFLGIVFGTVLVVVAGLYLSASLLYGQTFGYNTVINGIYCTGKSVTEVNSLLVSEYEKQGISVFYADNADEISLNEIDFGVDFTKSLSEVFTSQSAWGWIGNLFKSENSYTVEPVVSFSEEKLRNAINNLYFVKSINENTTQRLEIISKDGSYSLLNETHNTIDVETVYEACLAYLKNQSSSEIKATELDFEYSDAMQKTVSDWDIINEYLSLSIVLDMGDEKIQLSEEVLSSFLKKDSNYLPIITDERKLVFNDNIVSDFIDALCDKYDTYNLPRTYITFAGEEKHFEENNYYGTLLDRENEKAFLINALKEGISVEHQPQYKKKAYHRGLNDIGPEFIEVDLTKQKLYYVKDNELVLEADVVTGKPSQGTPTPEMVCYVYKKSEDTYLKGKDYYNHVDYWMAIHNKIGLHDASWQRKFGGDRYIKHGSHGCINMPKAKAEELYNLITVGVPVIVYK